jgi:type IV pilus biogenesis protein CpaD/CtpE
MKRITCRACDRSATVPLDHPALLCLLCLEDLDATRDRVSAWASAALSALDVTQAAWNATRAASPALSRWEAVQAALIGVAEKRVSQTTFDATWAKRKAEGGALAQLLEAYEAYARECDRLGAELARLGLAQDQINTAWLATNDI